MTEALRLQGRVALVTGASRGIGRAVAKAYAQAGAHVVALARTQGGLEELDDEIRALGGQATLVTLDLRRGDDIDQMGYALYQKFGRLDILAGIAGSLGVLSPVSHIPPKEWAEAMEVNLTANYRLMRSFDALLRQSDAGRAIFVTDSRAKDATPFWGAYAASKSGLETLARSWAIETARTTNLKINLVDPGPVRTHLRAQAYPGEDPMKHRPPAEVTGVFVDLAAPDCKISGEIVDA
jgi:NAD(P)-dependent dehydrogenase (short-subunit alcohol dehydrogenase family)